MNVPTLVVVTGRPAAGKTTLAHARARTIRCPALCRDEFKQGLLHTFPRAAVPDEHRHLNRQVYSAFFGAIELLLQNGITLVAEAAFQHKLWQPKLEPLQAIAQIRLIVCSIEPTLAWTRYIERSLSDPEREAYHPHSSIHVSATDTGLPISDYEPPHLADVPLLSVNTSD